MAPEPRDLIVMVVDDDPAIRRLIRKLLESDGFQVLECSSGREASARVVEFPWHILLLDLNLGDLDGKTLCQSVKSNAQFIGRHVIIVSADADPLRKVALLDVGAADYVAKPFHPAELVARVRAGARLVELQRRLITMNEMLARTSNNDGLTQLFNHKYFQEKVALEYESAVRYNRPLSIAMVDVDEFKDVNDTHGHAIGDQVLERIAAVLIAETRSSDITARYGGDEFALILRETRLKDAIRCGNRIASATRAARFDSTDSVLRVTVSIGFAALPNRRISNARQMLEYADRALYRAKRSGKNQVQAWGRPPAPRPDDEQNTRQASA